jgi:hypothetical protein
MDRTAATHASHDELLLARLYGGDVDGPERSRALDQMASCQECADLFADLGAIAAATAALPTPPRLRDFTLTEAEAARLGRRRIDWSVLGRLGRTRALGRSMMAAGLVGVVLVGAISVFAPGGGSGSGVGLTANGAPVSAGSAPGYEYGAPSPALDQNGSGRKSADGGTTSGTVASTAAPQASAAPTAQAPAASPAASSGALLGPAAIPTAGPAGSGEAAFGPNAGGQGNVQGGPSSGPPSGPTAVPFTDSGVAAAPATGPDARDVTLAAFAGLLILGALLLVVPRLAARRRWNRPR